MSDRPNNLRFDLLFWSLYFLYEWVGQGAVEDEYRRYFINAWMAVPTAFLASYLSVHWLVDRYYLKNKMTAFWIGEVAVALFFVMFRRTFNYYYTYPLYYPDGNRLQHLLFLPKIIIEFVNLYLIVFLYGMYYFVREWYRQQQLMQNLKQEKTAAELELLKSQVKPHFIFNMLNNIYSGALEKSPETAGQILKLSNFLDYSLYNAKKENVALKDELEYIRNYIELQKIRVGDKLDVAFNVFDTIEGIQITPLLLLPIIENCFKHGVNKSIGPSWIRVDISADTTELTVKVENSIETGSSPLPGKNGGLGLSNVKRRLELLYPNAYEFRTYHEKDSFLVVLKLLFTK